jgi:c-di-GMP-binding flagellar brake protein YcgR
MSNSEGSGAERRQHPRLDNQIPVKICQGDGEIVTQTANISRSGASCRLEQDIQPMTKLKIQLLLAVKRNNSTDNKKISCQGVVVRSVQAEEEGYFNVAIFFNDLAPKDAELISEYVHSYLEDQGGE